MSAASLDPESSQSSSGYEDGLGRRVLIFDRETGEMLERLVLRPELSAFEPALRKRIAIVAGMEDERFARPRSIERGARDRLTVVSEYVAGRRLSDVLEAAAEHGIVAGLDAGLGLLLELLPALARLHDAGLAHGALAAGRVMISPAGQLVLLDSIYAEPLERLKLTRRRLWSEFRLVFPASAGAARFDKSADLGHAAMIAAALTVGRPLGEDDYPDGIPALRQEIVEIASIRGSKAFADAVDKVFAGSLPIAGRRAPVSADEAAIDLRKLVRKELGITTCRTALLEFFQQVDAAEAERLAADAAQQEQRAREEADRIERERAARAKIEAERVERERAERDARERAERDARERAERDARERAENEARARAAAEKARLEAERLERERAEKARLEAERLEQERLEAERAEAERIEKARLEAERVERERASREAREREEKARLEAERLEKERAEKARLEAERLEAERVARARAAAEEARLEAERLERERLEAERARLEAERLERERAEREARERAEKEARERAAREARERAEKARLEAGRLERERAEKARLEERERAEKEARERAAQEARERAETARLEAERLERERRETERRERVERERAEKARLELERAEKARMEAERLTAERADAERRERELLEAARAARERADKARLEAERLEQARLDAEREAQEEARERAERARIEAERVAIEEARRERAAPAAPAGWLIPPGRASKFDQPIAETPPPAPTARTYPIYVPPAEPESWAPDPPLSAPTVTKVEPVADVSPGLASPESVMRPVSKAGPIRLKDEANGGAAPARAHSERYEPQSLSAAGAYEPFRARKEPQPIPWKLIAAGVVLIAVSVAIRLGFTPSDTSILQVVRKTAAPAAAPPVAATPVGRAGSLTITTQPAGAHVAIDGKPAGETPLTLDTISAGRHVIILTGASGASAKRTIRVEPGRTVAVDVPLYSGFAAISAPFVLDISEKGKALGVSDEQILLTPGTHTLRLTNQDLGYAATETVEIVPGEVTHVALDPHGKVNINAAPWAEVWIDGVKAGDTPLANVSVRLGVREFVFKNTQFGERKVVSTITANGTASVSVDFNK